MPIEYVTVFELCNESLKFEVFGTLDEETKSQPTLYIPTDLESPYIPVEPKWIVRDVRTNKEYTVEFVARFSDYISLSLIEGLK